MSKGRSDGYGEHSVPDEKSNNRMFGDNALFPGNFGVCYICNNGGNGGSDKIGKPYKIVVFDDKIGKNCKKDVVEQSNTNANNNITYGVSAGSYIFDGAFIFGSVRGSWLIGTHSLIIPRLDKSGNVRYNICVYRRRGFDE